MYEAIKQSLQQLNEVEVDMPNYLRIKISRHERQKSFSQLSNWQNSHTVKVKSSFEFGLPSLNKKSQLPKHSNQSANNSYCQIKQMDLKLTSEEGSLNQSFYANYLKGKIKKQVKQSQYLISSDRYGRNYSLPKQSHQKSQQSSLVNQILKKRKKNRNQFNLHEYLRTTQLYLGNQANKQ